jgi:hypothetical protein
VGAIDYFEEIPPPNGAPGGVVRLGVPKAVLSALGARHRNVMIAQYYGLVRYLAHAAHLFEGIERDLMNGDDMEGDRSVLAYTWRPRQNYIWVGGPQSGSLAAIAPPPGQVFVVLARRVGDADSSSGAEVRHWSWVQAAGDLAEAPVDWEQRYRKRVWSRE